MSLFIKTQEDQYGEVLQEEIYVDGMQVYVVDDEPDSAEEVDQNA